MDQGIGWIAATTVMAIVLGVVGAVVANALLGILGVSLWWLARFPNCWLY
jgi:uncharacterized membrane protein YeaQ/YmgE (transglycosylase-associated protein family)